MTPFGNTSAEPPPPRVLGRRPELLVMLFGLVVVGLVGVVGANRASTSARNIPLAGVTQDIELHLGLSHLWLEESLSGDPTVDVDRDIYANIDEARRLCEALSKGGATRFGTLSARGDSGDGGRFCRDIDAFRRLADARLAVPGANAAGSVTDFAYDATFRRLLAQADDDVRDISRTVSRDESVLRKVEMAVWLVLGTLFAAVALLVRRGRLVNEGSWRERSVRRLKDEHLATIVGASADAILSLTLDGRVVTWNAGAEAMFGYTASEMEGQSVRRLAPRTEHPGQADIVARVQGGQVVRGADVVRVRKDGTTFPAAITLSPILDGGEVVAISAIVRDVTDVKDLKEALGRRAFYDDLTDLPNRSLLDDRLSHALDRAARSGLAPAIILLDLDNFKAVNDSLGHVLGDQVLIEAARRLTGAVRPMDTVARLGGDEFVVLVEDATSGDAIGVAQRILESLKPPAEAGGHAVLLRASLGVALGHVGDEPEELFANADAAMYAAKASGKGHFRIFEPEMHTAALQRLQLSVDLAAGIGRGELFNVYQPIVELATGRVLGAEALVRWQHPTRGLVSPIDFIAIAEDTGQIADVGAQVLHHALHQLRRWQEDDPSFYVTVNASPLQFRRPDFVDTVVRAVEEAGVRPSGLVLEITETGLMNDVEANTASLARLRRTGVRIAIDDFGTGYSSIAYLKNLPVDIVKIDKSLVDGVAHDPGVWALLQAIIGLITAVGLETVAEGIESPAQVAHLEALGCTKGQGYHFARPMPADDLGLVVAGGAPDMPGGGPPPAAGTS